MQKVFVAMSGGVDSSVAAALLKERGYDVTGVFMKFWSPSGQGGQSPQGTVPGSIGEYCPWKEERADAARVAAKIGIPLLTWDFTHEYEKKVVEYMLGAYKAGITPNPDVMCNKEIKFGMFFNRAIAEGADFVATGHYARISKSAGQPFDFAQDKQVSGSAVLLKAKDINKDQSYFLYNLTQNHLEKTLFPIGDINKPQVRQIAEKLELSTASKKDSQGVCFIGPIKMHQFLKNYIEPKKGNILDKSGNILGQHDGVWYYTIGQRHGFDLKLGGGPYFIIEKNVKDNTIIVGGEADLYSNEAIVGDLNWIGEIPTLPAKINIKIRYRAEDVPARICPHPSPLPSRSTGTGEGTLKTPSPGSLPGEGGGEGADNNLAIKPFDFTQGEQFNNCLQVAFEKPVRAITPGQAAVFYQGDVVLGGGTIIA